MRALFLISQYVFGAWWLYSGLNPWFHFFEQPYGDTAIAIEYTRALENSGLLHIVKVMEVIQGVMILTGFMMPLAVATALPLSVMIAHWNFILTPGTVEIVFGALTLGFNMILMFAYWSYFKPFFTLKGKLEPAFQKKQK